MLDGAMKHAPVLACQMTMPTTQRASEALRERARRSFVTDRDYETFRAVLGHLREHCPAAKPVVVRTGWLGDGTAGACTRRSERFVIRLSKYLDEDAAVEALLHEWAHALAWNYTLDKLARTPRLDPAGFQIAAHDEAWGCAYSRVWREYLRALQ
jgi:hypothetical protein